MRNINNFGNERFGMQARTARELFLFKTASLEYTFNNEGMELTINASFLLEFVGIRRVDRF